MVEGNYLFLDMDPWKELPDILNDTWFVDVDVDTAMERVFARQVGNGVDPHVSRGRIEGNDRLNAELVQGTKERALVVVPSSIPLKATTSGKAS